MLHRGCVDVGRSGSARPRYRRELRLRCSSSAAPAASQLRRSVLLTPLLLTAAAPPPSLSKESTSERILDTANVLSPQRKALLERQLQSLEADTGFRIRVAAVDGQLDGRASSPGPDGLGFKERWGPKGDTTLYVLVDPTQRSILAFNAGASVAAKLSSDFLSELSGRYGNIFFVRDEGAAEAVSASLSALDVCLRSPTRCTAVPGVPPEGAWLTLSPSIVAGAVLGYAIRQQPSGGTSGFAGGLRGALITSPLWAFLLVSFGIAPVLLRDSDPKALLPNVGGFAAAAGLLYLTPIFGASPATRPRKDDDT